MAFQLHARIELTKPPGDVFAFLDDFQNTPKWNDRCVEVVQTSTGAHAVGAALRYKYKDARSEGEMTGSIREYEPGRALVMAFTDKMLDVVVGFRFSAQGGGTVVDHTIEITPKTFVMKVMAPIIKGATQKQVQKEVDALGKIFA